MKSSTIWNFNDSNPYLHIKGWELREIGEFCQQQKIEAESFLAEVEKNRANPCIITVTSEDGRSLDFAKITTAFDVAVVDRTKCEVLVLSDGRIVGGYGFDRWLIPPGFMVGTAKKGYFPFGYIETTSSGIAPECAIDEIAGSNPLSPWAFDMLTEYISDSDRRYRGLSVFKTFIQNKVIDRLRTKCEELVQVDFLITCLLKGDTDVFNLPLRSLIADGQYNYEGGGEIIRLVKSYIANMDLLHMSPPEKWDISLRDILVSQLVGDALEGK